jgi:hypothetical protein
VSGAEIHRRLSTQYGNSALPRRSVYEICQRLLDRYNNEGKIQKAEYGVETPGIANEEEIQAVHKWLSDQQKTFFVEGIRKLVDRWTKCIEKEGDYVEE